MDAIITQFQDKSKEALEKEIERQAKLFEQFKKAILKEAADNLSTYTDAFASKLGKNKLIEMMESANGGDEEKSEKDDDSDVVVVEDSDDEKSEDKSEKDDDDEKDDDEALPKGLDKKTKDKLAAAYEDLEEGKVLNVKTGNAITRVPKDSYRKGKFIGEKSSKKVVDWCHENLGSEDDEAEAEDDKDTEISPGFTKKNLDAMKAAVKKCPKGKYVLASTRKAMEKSDKNKGNYLWGAKFCVKKDAKDASKLFKALEKALE